MARDPGCCAGICLAGLAAPTNRQRRNSLLLEVHISHASTTLGAALDPELEKAFCKRVDFLSHVPVFRYVPKSQYPLLARSLSDKYWQAGDTVCQAGASVASFFIVAEGSAKIVLNESALEPEILHPGDYFGAKALKNGDAGISPITIIAEQNMMTLELSEYDFDNYKLGKLLRFPGRATQSDPNRGATGFGFLPKGGNRGRSRSRTRSRSSSAAAGPAAGPAAENDGADEVLSCLEGVDIMHGLWEYEKQGLVQSFEIQDFQADDWVVRAGEDVKCWFIVVDGELTCYHESEGQIKELAHLGTHMHFGERALLRSMPSEFSVKVTSASARCLLMGKEAFVHFAGFLYDEPLLLSAKDATLEAFMAEFKAVPLHQVYDSGRHVIRHVNVDVDSLTRIGILGSGSYGLVTLENDKRSGQNVAVKALSKGHIVETDSQEHVKRERELLLFMDSPFIVRLLMTSQDSSNLYFYFDPALGGDLRTLGSRNPDLFIETSKVTIFTVLCLTAAFGHIHERAIVFRDLKPENVLLNSAGVVQLCDFGLARLLLGKALTILGTPEYLAPEVIKKKGYDRMVDWWGLGVLTYELLAGVPPFGEEEDIGLHKLVGNINRGISSADTFPFANAKAKSFILRLLEKDPQKRLGKTGPREVAAMPYLDNAFKYDKLLREELEPPYVPQIDNDSQLQHFDQDVEPPPVVHYTPDPSGWDADF